MVQSNVVQSLGRAREAGGRGSLISGATVQAAGGGRWPAPQRLKDCFSCRVLMLRWC